MGGEIYGLKFLEGAVPRTIRTSVTDPIEISEIDGPSKYIYIQRGKIGITLCPGKKGLSSFGGTWDRDLETDLSAIEQQFKPGLALTLMTDSELSASSVHGLGEAFLNKGIQWIHFQTSELSPPDESSIQLWASIPYVLSLLMEGCNVLIHDRGGLGRAACLAAVLLIELGVYNSDAINMVRRSRPGAIETRAQEQFVLNYIPHNLPHFFCHGCVQNMIRLWGHIISTFNHLLRKSEGPIGAVEINVYRTFIQDFRHYMSGIGTQIDKITKSLKLSSKRFPNNLRRWGKVYHSGVSGGLYQPPDEPKLLVDWWRSVSLAIGNSNIFDNHIFDDQSFEEEKNQQKHRKKMRVLDVEAASNAGYIIVNVDYVPYPYNIRVESPAIYGYDTDLPNPEDNDSIWRIIDEEDCQQENVKAKGCLDGNTPRTLAIDWNQISKNQSIQLYEAMDSIQKYFDDYYQRLNQMITAHSTLLIKNDIPHEDYVWPRVNQHHLERGCEFPTFPSGNREDAR
ncbi:hypothetical protein FIM08_03725 [SAR202 cluster bacterium AC-647-N09_OGT_505m]|nr:hypothetical protein [SAR202 cluster bacterium AC-647-N09_OGT_505m]